MIRAQPLEGVWQTLGHDLFPGAVPRDVVPTWGPAGPESLGFTLWRPPWRVHSDLLPFTPVEWYPGEDASGDPLWAGYTQQAPPGGQGEATSVSCVGWHFYREDKPSNQFYVHDDLSAWTDLRSDLDADLSVYTAGYNVETGGVVSITYPGPVRAAGGFPQAAVLLDLGVGNTAARVVLDWVRSGTWAGTATAYMYAGTSPATLGSLGSFLGLGIAGANSGTATVTLGTPRRFVAIVVDANTIQDAATFFRLTGARVFADTTYESAGASVFTATQGIKRSRDLLTPLLSGDNSRIDTVTFPIRHASWIGEDATARQQQDAFNDYHGYRFGVDASRRVFFQAQPSSPRLQVDAADPRVDYVPTSTNDGSELYNAVSVRGRSGSGRELRVDKVLSDFTTDTSLLTRRSRQRSFTLNVAAATDATAMAELAEVWLLAHRSVPHKANLSIEGSVVVDLQANMVVPADHLGRYCGEMIRVLSVPDPDTGGLQSRDGIVASVQGVDPCSLAIDTERRSLEALMARMGVVRS